MDKAVLISLIEKGYSIRKIQSELKVSNGGLRYWLKKYNLKTNISSKVVSDKKVCTLCLNEFDLSEFYNKKDKKSTHSYCKKCVILKTIERQKRTKQMAVDYKGGKCEKCGYNKYIGALQFHHLDPLIKDRQWNTYKLRAFDDNFKRELDKCILLCANCHAEEHSYF